MLRVRFVLVPEGSSDAALVATLQRLCVACGADEAVGVVADLARLPKPPGQSIPEAVPAALQLEPSSNVVFVHRDSDNPDTTDRLREINTATAGVSVPVVPVVPAQMTESWLLLDEAAIRLVAGNPNGRVALDLPRPERVHRISDAKATLSEKLELASELRGRRLQRFRMEFFRNRRRLLEMLTIDGSLSRVAAWKQLVRVTSETIERLATGHGA